MGRRIGTFAAIGFAVSSLSHCVGATEIMVDLRTDVACDVVGANGVTIAVGEPGDETTGISAKATTCDGGEIGTLALTPRGDIGGPVALRVVLGVNAKAEDCASPKFSGCIVARRSLRYSPHAELTLPIDLDQDCLDDPCGPDSTCIHGSCTDAGVTCDANVCGIDAGAPPDAGPPDAGSCTDTPSTLVGSTSIVSTPHIARTAKGYAVAWLVGSGSIYAETIDVNGLIIAPARPIAQLGGTAKIDAIATDTGDQNYLLVYEDGATVFGAVASTTGGPASVFNIPNATGPVSGAFWEATQTVWVTAAVTASGMGNLYTAALPTSTTTTTITTASPTHLALARFGTTYYPTTTEGSSCVLRTCALQTLGTFACQPNVFQGCSAMRAAADAANVVVSYVASGTMYFARVGGGPAVPSGPVDDLDAMVPLVVGSTPYRVVWRSTGAILTDTFPTKLVAADTLDSSGFGSATGGAGFDAVADGPAETGYAVVYVRGSNPSTIQFLHRCK